MTIDEKNFYYQTPMKQYKYMRICMNDLKEEIIQLYELDNKQTNVWFYVEVRKGMPGMPQVGLLANKLLPKRLAKHGYFPCTTPRLWRLKWHPFVFTLVVDDFGVQYVGHAHAQNLIAAIGEHYEHTMDWTGKKYSGLDIEWNSNKREVRISMNGYIS